MLTPYLVLRLGLRLEQRLGLRLALRQFGLRLGLRSELRQVDLRRVADSRRQWARGLRRAASMVSASMAEVPLSRAPAASREAPWSSMAASAVGDSAS